jgi:hypothetical protein
MKKILLLLILPILLFVTACQKTEYVIPNRTILTEVRIDDWKTTDLERTYSASIDMPEIDNFFNENGAALVYVSFGTVGYEQIPQVFEGVSYRYVTRPGQIIITIENSDGEGRVFPPEVPMDVKIILIDSQ